MTKKTFSDDDFATICQRIAKGESFKEIFADKKERRAFFALVNSNQEYGKIYKSAKNIRRNPNIVQQMPTNERLYHNGGIDIEPAEINAKGKVVSVRARVRESHVLDWYFNKGSIDKQMLEAGLKFHYLFFGAGKMPRTTVMWRERIQKSFGTQEEYQDFLNSYTDAQRNLLDALEVLNSDEQDVLWEVAGLCNRAGTPRRTQSLKTGLRALAVYWRIPI